MRGLIRQHQFDKVELVKFTRARAVVRRARGADRERREGPAGARPAVPHACCCAPATWASPRRRPTTSRCGCRARDATARFRRAATARPSRRAAPRSASARRREASRRYAHTLNGSGLAVGRTLIAIAGELPAGRRLGGRPRGAASLHGRPRAHRAARRAAASRHARRSGQPRRQGVRAGGPRLAERVRVHRALDADRRGRWSPRSARRTPRSAAPARRCSRRR